MNGIERVEQAHNDYLQILADAGIVGLILAGFFIYQLFRTGLAKRKTENIFSARCRRRRIGRLFCDSGSQPFRFCPAHDGDDGYIFDFGGAGRRQRQTFCRRRSRFMKDVSKRKAKRHSDRRKAPDENGKS